MQSPADTSLTREPSRTVRVLASLNRILSLLFGAIAVFLLVTVVPSLSTPPRSTGEGEGQAMVFVLGVGCVIAAAIFLLISIAFRRNWRAKWLLQALPAVPAFVVWTQTRMTGRPCDCEAGIGAGPWIYVALVMAIVLAVMYQRGKRRAAHYGREGFEAAHEAYSGLPSPPVVTRRTETYGYPGFTVTFATREEFLSDQAQAANARFLAQLDTRLRDAGPRSRRFEAALAVAFDYPGRLDDIFVRQGVATMDELMAKAERLNWPPA
jgi:hypothetical protein